MRRKVAIFLLGVVDIAAFLFSQAALAQTDYSGEKITNFHADITINGDSSFLVEESIRYDFGTNWKHGIYRDIPTRGAKIKAVKVVEEADQPYQYQVSGIGTIHIKIGDPEQTIQGEHLYHIYYTVKNEIGFFKDHDELYWNVTGNEWQVPIETASAVVSLPQKVLGEKLMFSCFTGPADSKEQNCSYYTDDEGNVHYQANRQFAAGEGLTIIFGFPKGIVREPTKLERVLSFLSVGWGTNWPFVIPILVFVYLFRQWWRKGRDFPLKKPIIAQYDPPENLGPAEVGVLIKQSIEGRFLSATIVDLAIRGYLKIKEEETKVLGFKTRDYSFEKLKDFYPDKTLKSYEIEILRTIFAPQPKSIGAAVAQLKKTLGDKNKKIGEMILNATGLEENQPEVGVVKLSQLKNTFYQSLDLIKEKIYAELKLRNYISQSPDSPRNAMILIGVAFIGIPFFLIPLFSFSFLWRIGISFPLSGILFIIFALFMPKRTEKGAEAYWQSLGLKEYINTAEKYRMQFQEKENIFEKLLPFAIVFNIVDKWAKAFEGIYTTPPQWYEGSYAAQFSAIQFSNSLSHSLSSINFSLS